MEEEKVYQVLNELKIAFEVYHHPPVFTVEEAAAHWEGIPGRGCKNLFLRDKKGTEHYLVVVPDEKRVDILALSTQENLGRLSFGSPERLMKYLGLTPGSVSPFGIINDQQGCVHILVDRVLMEEPLVTFHPNVNTATLALSASDFKKFLDSRTNTVVYVTIPEIQE